MLKTSNQKQLLKNTSRQNITKEHYPMVNNDLRDIIQK